MEQPATRMQMASHEAIHTLLMFTMIIPFYLYGANILSANQLYEDSNLVVLFVVRVAVSVILAEGVFNWVPHYILQQRNWRTRPASILISGLIFGLMTYWVLSPIHFEGEAVYGMLIVWVIAEAIVNSLFKKMQWYH